MSQMLLSEHAVKPSSGTGMSVQNTYCLRYAVVAGRAVARQGTMIAYRGDLRFTTRSQGVRKLVKRAVTGEGVALMEIDGTGEVWLADRARNVHIVPGDGLTVTGKNVLCFDDTLQYEIGMEKGAGMNGGGLFNCHFTGTGSLAITTAGEPIVLAVSPEAPVYVDTNSVVGWTHSLATSIRRSEGIKSLVRGGSGELYQLCLSGEGSVIVQPSEGPPRSAKGAGGVVDTIGEFLG